MARRTTPAWLYIVLALIAGLALGGLIFTWMRPFPGGPSTSTPTTTSTPPTAAPSNAAPSAAPATSAQPPARLTPPPENDQLERRPARRSVPAEPASRPRPATGTSDAPPMTERPPIVTSPVPIPPPITSNPVPPTTSESSAAPSTAYPSNRRRAVQETDAEAGLTVPSSPSGDATAGAALTTRQSNNNSDSSGRPVLHRARNAEDTDPPSETTASQTPARIVPSARPAYNGPTSGTVTWTGKLEKNETLTINGGIPSIGILAGAGLPGVPITITVDQTNLGFAEMPGASNNYGRIVLKSHAKHDKIVLHWTVIQ